MNCKPGTPTLKMQCQYVRECLQSNSFRESIKKYISLRAFQ
ncbi:hypothetical protein EV11_1048 [Prochlorococcus sp. SS52]|nr:hypothetical protein EV04_1643 [Prochlorococcus marinus str. LG]KGG21104.1 hypothetical protein EV08_0820 [Prochlorococcus marinus str. SS2]KGG23929.1 hypothetical protein EV09_0533 [Prochlorococcus marinus str. SS35]KGG31811.1 hypothetical protein EV10_1909 [Prochlorococcus marinus str. SS51]KGG36024.1 hypothetical protein EV11_1048 [Prochlorococcus sp. SS52]